MTEYNDESEVVYVDSNKHAWYNSKGFSHLGEGLGIAVVIIGIGMGIDSCNGTSNNDVKIEKAKQGYSYHEKNVIGDPDKREEFYLIEEERAYVEIDGERIEDRVK
ncbi:hypothetical protein CL617_02040 [archaeon]|jgi:hypothetical protein|nr:hypothetical protein [archaeon]|tara:strand:- start:7129 stop:7446 length:318 start_codon:yes stop_codon:yes gene_type:complete